jgi:hypothetical protein
MLSRSVKVTIGENSYDVNFPNNGQLIDIEGKKAALTNGLYAQIAAMNNSMSNRALDMVDCLAYFVTLIPDLSKNLQGIKNVLELTPEQSKPLLRAYKKEFLPWFEGWMKELLKEEEEEEKSNS